MSYWITIGIYSVLVYLTLYRHQAVLQVKTEQNKILFVVDGHIHVDDAGLWSRSMEFYPSVYDPDALKFVGRKKEQLDTLQKIDEWIEAIEEAEEEKTTNGIF